MGILTFLTALVTGVGCVWWFVALLWNFQAYLLCLKLFKTPFKSSASLKSHPGVSILRPLKGIDENLADNLKSTFMLDYPAGSYEIILSVAEENDPAIELARKVMSEHPEIDATLIIGDRNVDVNPKVNNMVRGYKRAKYDIIWICDSNVSVEPDTLTIAVDLLTGDGNFGLVHHTPQGIGSVGMGARLEEMFLNTAHAKIYLVFNWFQVESCVMGKSTLFRRSDLNKTGGLAFFGKYMAEDNMIGTALKRLGRQHYLSPRTAVQPLMQLSIKDYILRRSRWTRIRAYSLPLATLVEPLTECFAGGLFSALGLYYHFSISPLLFLLFYTCAWFSFDYCISHVLSPTMSTSFHFTAAWFLRESSAIPIYLFALFGSNEVSWRGKRYMLRLGGVVEPLSSSGVTAKGDSRTSCFAWDLVGYLSTVLYGVLTRKQLPALSVFTPNGAMPLGAVNSFKAFDDDFDAHSSPLRN